MGSSGRRPQRWRHAPVAADAVVVTVVTVAALFVVIGRRAPENSADAQGRGAMSETLPRSRSRSASPPRGTATPRGSSRSGGKVESGATVEGPPPTW